MSRELQAVLDARIPMRFTIGEAKARQTCLVDGTLTPLQRVLRKASGAVSIRHLHAVERRVRREWARGG